jgi:hypothetical protein
MRLEIYFSSVNVFSFFLGRDFGDDDDEDVNSSFSSSSVLIFGDPEKHANKYFISPIRYFDVLPMNLLPLLEGGSRHENKYGYWMLSVFDIRVNKKAPNWFFSYRSLVL